MNPEELKNMAQGNITEEELNRAKEDTISSLDRIIDSPSRIVTRFEKQEMLGLAVLLQDMFFIVHLDLLLKTVVQLILQMHR